MASMRPLQKPPRTKVRRPTTCRLGTGLATGVSTAMARSGEAATAGSGAAAAAGSGASGFSVSNVYPSSTLISTGQMSACPWPRKKLPIIDRVRYEAMNRGEHDYEQIPLRTEPSDAERHVDDQQCEDGDRHERDHLLGHDRRHVQVHVAPEVEAADVVADAVEGHRDVVDVPRVIQLAVVVGPPKIFGPGTQNSNRLAKSLVETMPWCLAPSSSFRQGVALVLRRRSRRRGSSVSRTRCECGHRRRRRRGRR